MNLTAIPRELQERTQWVCWQNRDGKKMPYDAKTGRAASTTNPATWSTFETALKAFETVKTNGKPHYSGSGFVFVADDGFCGIDLDDCIAADGNLKAWAAEIMALFADSYSEVSPSGSGIKLFVRGRLSDGKGRKWPCEDGAIEVYDRSRYFTVTGDQWPGTSSELRDGQAGIDTLLTRFTKPKQQAVAPQLCGGTHHHAVDRQQVIEWATEELRKVDHAVSGQGGHNTTFKAACVLVKDFNLTVEEAWHPFVEWNQRCSPPWDEADLRRKLTEADKQEGPRGSKLIVTCINPSDIPPDEHDAAFPRDLSGDAYHGLGGQFVEAVFPETEASRPALLMHFLAYFAAMAGRDRYYEIGGTRHHARLFVVTVGDTSNGRKGTANDLVREFFRMVDSRDAGKGDIAGLVKPFVATNILKGIVSGEGVIHHVRDECSEHGKTIVGVLDKRLLILETEFGGSLKIMSGRDGNTLSSVLRDCWDGVDLRTAAKNEPRYATAPHINLLGHITSEELRLRMSNDDCTNGLANRILWSATQRSKSLPFGGALDWNALKTLAQQVMQAVEFSQVAGQMRLSPDARILWEAEYEGLNQPRFGLVGKACERAAPQCLRLAMTYALLDCSDHIELVHLRAALEVWRYCEESAIWAFGTLAGDRTANEIERALRHIAPRCATPSALHDLFGRNKPAHEIRQALGCLMRAGRITETKSPRAYRIS